jgi:hypothetical protein
MGLTDSADLKTPVVASGVVRKADHTTAAYADVVLYAWPSNDVVAQMKPGDSVKLQPVAAATADQGGSFVLRIPKTTSMANFADAHGNVNLELDASAPGLGRAPYGFARKFDRATNALAGSKAAGSLASTASTQSGVSAPDGAENVDLTLGVGGVGLNSPSLATGTSASVNKSVTTCTVTLLQDYGPNWAIVGQTYSQTTGVKHQFTYRSGSTSSISYGVSATGNLGTFSLTGTFDVSSSGSIPYATQGDNTNMYYETEFKLGKYRRVCSAPRALTTTDYVIRSSGWVGGSLYVRPTGAPAAKFCAPHNPPAGSSDSFTKETTNAVTWLGGFSTGGVVGINMNIKTGYDTASSITFTFNQPRKLCGTSDYEGGTPSQLVAKA